MMFMLMRMMAYGSGGYGVDCGIGCGDCDGGGCGVAKLT